MISKYISHVWGSWQEVLGGGTVASRWPCDHSGGVSPGYSAVMAGSACWDGVENGACVMWSGRGCGSAGWHCYVAVGKCLAFTCAFLCRRRSTKKKWITKCLRYILRMLSLTSSHPQAKSLVFALSLDRSDLNYEISLIHFSQLPVESSLRWSWVGSLNKIKSF